MTATSSFGQFTRAQVEEAMALPFGRAMAHLEQLKRGACEFCHRKNLKDLQAHYQNSQWCGAKAAAAKAAESVQSNLNRNGDLS